MLVKAAVAEGKVSRSSSREVWGLYVETARELAACAMALLDITASEAAVERSFSRQGFIHSKLRNRLLSNSIHMEMAFSFNMRALEPTPASRAAMDRVEIADEDIAEDEGRGTRLLCRPYLPDEALAPAAEEVEERSVEAREGSAVEQEVEVRQNSGEMSEEEMEHKHDNTPTEAERTADFIRQWLIDNPHTQGYRWVGWRQQKLGAAIIEAGLGHTVDNMIKLIKDHLADTVTVVPL